MIGSLMKVVAFMATTAVAVPYTTALLCNLAYGWPQVQNKFKRAFSPKKVFSLNFVLIQKLVTSLRFMPLYLQWRAYYKMATTAEIMKDRKYGRNDQTLDLYFPRERIATDDRTYPVLVFVYGGAWGSGNKKMYGLMCSALANRLGMIVCCPNHSTYPQGYIDDMIQDIVDCISWLYDNVEHYNGNKNKMVLLGHSSGAHLCMMSTLELLHDEVVRASSVPLHPVTNGSMQFSERHFSGSTRSEADNGEDRHSTGSSGSFCVVSHEGSENGNQMAESSASSQFELLQTQKSETEFSEASMLESELRELTQAGGSEASMDGKRDMKDSGPGITGKGSRRDTENKEKVTESDEEEEDSGDDASVVTVKSKDQSEVQVLLDGQPSLLQLSRCIKAVIGLSGVYHIADHFQHEMKRGVEDVSTMARSMYGEDHFDRFSPTHIVGSLNAPLRFPHIVLVHGTDDYVVPLSSSTKFYEELQRLHTDVTVRIIPSCDHYEVCLDLMKVGRKFNHTIMTIIEDTVKSVLS